MPCLEDYEVLSILGTSSNSACYKVKNKSTSETFVWKAANYEGFNREDVLEKIEVRKSQQHGLLLRVHDYILHEDTSTVYLILEHCEHGTLDEAKATCQRNGDYLNEDFVWRCLYKLACQLKLFPAPFCPHETFIADAFELKFVNFQLHPSAECDFPEAFKYLTYEADKFPEHYSDELRNVAEFLVRAGGNAVDAILCHPTVITRTTRSVEGVYAKKEKTGEDKGDVETYHIKLENLRRREAALKSGEMKLMERAYALNKREKKVAVLERAVKEKMARAEVYLMRAKEGKPKRVPTILEVQDANDTSLSADCGDTSILPTSNKLNVQEISKPPKFTRTLSERRVRFKSHSPLKDVHNIRHRTFERSPLHKVHSKPRIVKPSKENLPHSDSEKSGSDKPKKKFALSSMFSRKMKKANSVESSSDTAPTYEEADKDWEDFREDDDCKPINWTEESKRQAFELLRIMNGDQLKHTFL